MSNYKIVREDSTYSDVYERRVTDRYRYSIMANEHLRDDKRRDLGHMWYEVPEDGNAFGPVVNESQYKMMNKEMLRPHISPKHMAAEIKHDVEEDLL